MRDRALNYERMTEGKSNIRSPSAIWAVELEKRDNISVFNTFFFFIIEIKSCLKH
jgi:hypothetical protein